MPIKMFFDNPSTNTALPLLFLASSMACYLVLEIITIYMLIFRPLAYVLIFLTLETLNKANFLAIFCKNKTHLLLKVLKAVCIDQN